MPDEYVPPHFFLKPCSAVLLPGGGEHDPEQTSPGRVFCRRCGMEAVVRVPEVKLPPPPMMPGQLHPGLHVTGSEVERNREALVAFAKVRGFESVRLIRETAAVPWALRDADGTHYGAKAVNRKRLHWGQHEDFAFSAERWHRIVASLRRQRLPGIFVVTAEADWVRGWMPIDPALVIGEWPRGARGFRDRGDRHDDEMMVHFRWDSLEVFDEGVRRGATA